MYRRNFLFHQYPGCCFTAGKPFAVEVPRPGKYKVTITLKTEAPLENVSICTGSGNLSFTGSIPSGVFKHIAVVNVGDTVPEGHSRISHDRVITTTVTAETDCLSSLSVSEISCPTIYIAGSSIEIPTKADGRASAEPHNARLAGSNYGVADEPHNTRTSGSNYGADTELHNAPTAGSDDETSDEFHNKITAPDDGTDRLGARSALCAEKSPHDKWEQMLNAYTGQNLAVSDHSHAGLTTESFRKEGHYAAINEYSRPGDFYFFQFAPTGQTIEDWAPGGNCRRQLARYIIECRERLAYPVLLTPAVRCSGETPDDDSAQLWKQCLEAYREVSALTATPVIELHKLNVSSCDAYAAAGSVAQEIARTCGKHPEKRYRFLAKCMRTKCS